MKTFLRLIIICSLLISFISCKKDSPEPKKIDPIITLEIRTLEASLNVNDIDFKISLNNGSQTDLTVYGIEYKASTGAEWEKISKQRPDPNISSQAYLLTLSNIKPNTKYIYRAFLKISGETTYSEEQDITSGAYRYSIGKLYPYGSATPEGVVVDITDDKVGLHGIIVSLDETFLVWSTETVITGATHSDGSKNMAQIKAIDPTLAKYPAFKWCNNKGQGWFLPSGELSKVSDNKTIINTAIIEAGGTIIDPSNGLYWSSAEASYSHLAWWVFFYNGTQSGTLKQNIKGVRAVKLF